MKDLTVGRPGAVLTRFALPLMGSVVFQQLYNIADSFVAGKFIGDYALSAVGNAYEITLVYLAIAFGCNIGCSVVLSRLFGAREYSKLKTAVTTNFISSGIICALLMICGFIFIPSLLRLINTPAEIFDDTVLYLNIYTLGLAFLFFYNISNGIFSALGDSKTPFIFLSLSSTANIFMDILFVAVFKMKIDGVAWATFICQGISCIAAVATVSVKLSKIKCDTKPPVFSFDLLKQIYGVALPSMTQQLFVSIGNIFIQGIVNSCGTLVIAGYSAAIKINNFSITSFSSLGNAMSNYTAQNYGAGNRQRIRQGLGSGVILAVSVAAFFSVLYVAFRTQLISIFMNDMESDALTVGCNFLLIVAPFFFVPAVKITCDGVLRGACMMRAFLISTFTDLLLRVVLAFVFSRLWGYIGIWVAWPIGWCIATCMSVFFATVNPGRKIMGSKTE